jgi:mRNA-degrading endonuclease RelE of RelBE toxin-antitoxin system
VIHEVRWTPGAQRDIARLSPRIAGAIVVYVDERLALNPMRLSKDLGGSFDGMRAARTGDFRVLFTLELDKVLYVVRIDHRAHLYRHR